MFCIDHLVMVDIVANEEALIFDFQTVTTPGPGGKVTGLEAVMQVSTGNGGGEKRAEGRIETEEEESKRN